MLQIAVDERTTPVSPEYRPPPPRVAVLVGRSAEVAGAVFELQPPVVLGRDATLAVSLPHEGVSRRHAEIVGNDAGALVLHDLGSTNGTVVNGVAVTSHLLANGDRLVLGSVELEYRLGTAAEHRRAQQAAAALAMLSRLSERELEVARCVAQGKRSEEIGRQLHIATRTVNTHLEHIYDRLEIKSRAALAALITQAES